MVNGLGVFRDYFKGLEDAYLLIGGSACDVQFEEKGLTFRATKDLDIILVAEALTPGFIERFWQFIRDGGYENREKSDGQKQYYRFTKPKNPEFPVMLELFSRKPDVIAETKDMTITPIPADDDLSSLSAILMDEEYYRFTRNNTELINDLPVATEAALICLKAKAYLDLSERKEKGEDIESKKITKHRSDVIRLAVTLDRDISAKLEGRMRTDMIQFLSRFAAEEPVTKDILKSAGLPVVEWKDILFILEQAFL